LYVAKPAYDLTAFGARIEALQRDGHPVAHAGSYHGQFQYVGRLTQPISVVPSAELANWAAAHPDGYIVLYHGDWPTLPRTGADHVQDYRGDPDDLALWSAAKWIAAQ